jgi:hypothetical protein
MRWSPQPGPQTDAIRAHVVPELLFGGARGGGKSSFLLGDYCAGAVQGPAWRGIIFRQTYPELEELIHLSRSIVPACWPGSEWLQQPKTWKLPNGSELRMRNLEDVGDAAHYQGHSYTFIGFDELCSWKDALAYQMLMACLRSTEDVRHKRIRASANPGGPGHAWVKARFIDPAPLGYEPIVDELTGQVRVFIPSRLEDNRILMAQDPAYIERLKGVGSPELVKAWLEGDWSVVVGAFFPEFGAGHVRRPFRIPAGWLRFKAMDWGSARPCAVLWCAVSDGDVVGYPRGALVVYRELYLASAPNVGLRLTVEQVASRIHEIEIGDEKCGYSIADPAIFAQDGGPSIAERFAARGVMFKPADNKRVGRTGAMAGWDLVRQRLIGEDDQPMLYVLSTCNNLIRTLPVMQHDAARPEDVDTQSEDHAVDALRYACASRPWVKTSVVERRHLSMNMLWEMREQSRARH